jgi:uncharacterized protein (TIGR00730 family)
MSTAQRSVCIFCGSASGEPIYQRAARELGERIALARTTLVYGGGNIGLMGILADATLEASGEVIGVIPQFLIDLEVAHRSLTKLIVVESMHERKAEMASRADAFVALPGGFGTMEEFFEVLTWLQLNLHNKPCILLNVNGFYTPLLHFLRASHESGFISTSSMDLITVCETIDELMNLILDLPEKDRFREERT